MVDQKTILFLVVFAVLLSVGVTQSDIKEGELQYLANHLTLAECRHLVASLHHQEYEDPSFETLIEDASRLPQDSSCQELLHDWNLKNSNSTPQVLLSRRLAQMQREDLSVWLSESVFQELARGLEDSILEGVTGENDYFTESDLFWTESVIEVDGPEDDEEAYGDSDDDIEVASEAFLMSGAVAGFLWFIYKVIKLVLQKRKENQSLA